MTMLMRLEASAVNDVRFISDLHLDASRPQMTDGFFRYLSHLCEQQTTQALYILGDLFEMWIGDDDDSVLAAQVFSQLKQATSMGLTIYVMQGNRDFLLRKSFGLATGCIMIDDPLVTVLGKEAILLLHGDSLCVDDHAYQAFRAQIRNRDVQWDFLSKSLNDRREYAAYLRSQSATMNSSKPEAIMDVNQQAVMNAMTSYQCQIMIHGHTHRPASHRVTLPNNQQGSRYVLGDWRDDGGWELVYNRCGYTLHSFTFEDL